MRLPSQFFRLAPLEPELPKPQAPDHVMFPLAKIVGDVTAADLSETAKIQVLDQVLANEAPQQIRHNLENESL